MYVTIKLEGKVGSIHCVNIDGKEIIPDLRYNIAPHTFVHHGGEGFSLREAVNSIINQKKEIEETNKELELKKNEMNKKRKKYYEKNMKEEIERINRLRDFYERKLEEIREAPIDIRPNMLRKLYKNSQKNEHLEVTITSFGIINEASYPKYPPEVEIKVRSNVEYDTPTMSLRLLGGIIDQCEITLMV